MTTNPPSHCAQLTSTEEDRDVVLALRGVGRVIDGVTLLKDVSWEVRSGQRWVVLGANGSGKTTLVRIASMWMHPSSGEVELLGAKLGTVDVRKLRTCVGFTSAAMADQLRPQLTAIEVVMTAKNGALEPWWHSYDTADRLRARQALDLVGCGSRAEHRFGTLSSGERQRVLLARALSTDPEVIMLDEPNAGLDLAGREELVTTLSNLAADTNTPPLVLVTHHTEEIPDSFTHALLLRQGRVLAQGPLHEVLTAQTLSACFGINLELQQTHNRWTARAIPQNPLTAEPPEPSQQSHNPLPAKD